MSKFYEGQRVKLEHHNGTYRIKTVYDYWVRLWTPRHSAPMMLVLLSEIEDATSPLEQLARALNDEE